VYATSVFHARLRGRFCGFRGVFGEPTGRRIAQDRRTRVPEGYRAGRKPGGAGESAASGRVVPVPLAVREAGGQQGEELACDGPAGAVSGGARRGVSEASQSWLERRYGGQASLPRVIHRGWRGAGSRPPSNPPRIALPCGGSRMGAPPPFPVSVRRDA